MYATKIIMGRRAVLAIATAALLCGVGPTWAHDRVQQILTAPGGGNALGRARLVMKSDSDGRLVLAARGLAPNQTYDVIAGDVKVGTLRTSGGGNGAVRFRSRPRGRDLMLGFDPRGALITLRAADGTDVLLGTVPTTPGDSPDKIACCLPDDSGQECEDRTAEECTAQGGVVTAATSCLPNPCEGAPPVSTEIICCEPDDSGPECEDRSAAECAARGGVVVAATSCSPNPCAPIAPADPDIRCCVPDDSGAECEDRTADQCAAQGGVDIGPGSCSPDPCADVAPQTPATTDDHGGRRGRSQSGGGDDGGGDNHGGSSTYYGVSTAALKLSARTTPARVDDPAGDDHGRHGRGADDPAGDDRGGHGHGADDRSGKR